MTADEVKASLAKAARRAWPRAARASDLPLPEYWKGATEWLCFQAPHVGDRLMRQYIEDVVREAVLAEAAGKTPKARTVPDKVREILANVAEHSAAIRTDEAKAEEKRTAWELTAERAAEVRSRFATRANAVQRRLL